MAKTRHKSPRTAMRYVNLGPAAVAQITELWTRRAERNSRRSRPRRRRTLALSVTFRSDVPQTP